MLSASNLSKTYSENSTNFLALKDATFEINAGEFVAIMGPSGSGKSTLLHVLSFLDRPTSGSYSFFGKKMEELSDEELAAVRNKEMGFVFQAFNLLGRSTVYDNVELPLIYSGAPEKTREEKIRRAVDSVGLSEKLHTEAGRLSGGQKQRVAIARALVNEPNVIFADEPTGNLDSESGSQVMKILSDLNRAGRTVILVTHENYTAEYAKRKIYLKDGKVERDEHAP